MQKRRQGSYALTLLLALGLPAASAGSSDTAVADLAGYWIHDQGRSEQHYMGPEYPGRWMKVELVEGGIEVEQSLGGVRDGLPLPGSGETTAMWTLPTDGSLHEVTTGKFVRSMSARWNDGALQLAYSISLGDEGEMVCEEAWRPLDDGASIVIARTVRFGGREKTRRIFFRRRD